MADLKYTLQYGGNTCGCGESCKVSETDIIFGFLKKEGQFGFWGAIKRLVITETAVVLHASEEDSLPNPNIAIRVKDLLKILGRDKFGRETDAKLLQMHSLTENTTHNIGFIEKRHNISYELPGLKTEFSGKGGIFLGVNKAGPAIWIKGLFSGRLTDATLGHSGV